MREGKGGQKEKEKNREYECVLLCYGRRFEKVGDEDKSKDESQVSISIRRESQSPRKETWAEG